MIRTILSFRPDPAAVSEIERIYAAGDVLAYSLEQTRAIMSELVVDIDDPDRPEVVVTALWPDEAAYQEWLDHPRRAAAAPGLPDLVGPVGAARRYAVRQRVVKATDGSVRHDV
jgi:quinol monooxygenase YgiN